MGKSDYIPPSADVEELPLFRGGHQPSRRRIWAGLAMICSVLLLSGYVWGDTLSRLCYASRHENTAKRWRTPSYTRNPAYMVEATNGAVASENVLCSEIGVDIMRKGGNAIDSVISTTLCVGVLNMFSSGIGGGGFMTVRIPPSSPHTSSEVYTIDFREAAPAAANSTMYAKDPISAIIGGLAVGVPGELRGLQEAHKRWGTLPWKTLVQPSAELAKGWRVQTELARRINSRWMTALMQEDPDWKPIFAPRGRVLQEGDLIRRENLSRTLATIAEEGADAFYKGAIADSIVAKIQATGGVMTVDDLEKYTVRVEKALQSTYRGRKIYTPHAPASSMVMIYMLNLMEHYEDLIEEGRTTLNVHRLLEAMKFGFAARTKVSDRISYEDLHRMVDIPTKGFSDRTFPNITDDITHPPEYYHPIYDIKEDHGTSHSSVVDKNGMAVALTSTVNLLFGSQVLDPVTGIILNDEMDDFSIPGMPNAFGIMPSPFNYPEPGKRPLSSITPTIMENEDGSFYLAIGASGGSRISPSVFQTILNLDWGLDVSASIEYGRLHDQLYPLKVEVDDAYDPEIADGLREKGHNVTIFPINRVAAVVQAVVKSGDKLYAASDSRKNGIPAGY